jgi:arginyl-tRNA synthetase
VEYSNVNTHKEYHVGHLRNLSYGDTVVRLLAANGYKAIPVSYVNDFGSHVAKTIWQWQRDKSYQTPAGDKGYLLGRCYVAASQELARHPEAQSEVAAIMKEIESRQGANYRLWQKTRNWSIKYFQTIYRDLGVKFDHIFYENEVIDDGLKLVKELIAKGILVKSEGAIIANLEKYDLGVLPIIRTDGTALYPAGDLALAAAKHKRFQADESIYVIDVRQSLYFKQLFKILSLAGDKEKLIHLAYDFVTLPGGMMSSRTGQVITYEELKDKLLAKLIAETKTRHAEWTANRVEQAARNLAMATIKFELLKVSQDKIITFNIDEAARFDGFTACYLEYSYARLKSIIRRERLWSLIRPFHGAELKDAKEKQLWLKVARYGEAVKSAGEHYDPSVLAKYLFELAQLSNDYYHSTNILKAPAPVKRARLALIKAVAQTLKNGLNLLGIKALEEM